MNKKIYIITAIIAFPIALIFFFQFFSEGRYDIPLYYQRGVSPDTLVNATCIERKSEQYYVTNSLLTENIHRIIHFERFDGPVLKTRLEELERVQNAHSMEDRVKLLSFINSSTMTAGEVTDYSQRVHFYEPFWKIKALDSAAWATLKFCDLVMSNLDNRVVLVDSKNRIRGYYNIMEREETDRLIAEVSVLLTNKELP